MDKDRKLTEFGFSPAPINKKTPLIPKEKDANRLLTDYMKHDNIDFKKELDKKLEKENTIIFEPQIPKSKPLEFLDDAGTILKGFSQVDLEKLNENIQENNLLLEKNHTKLEENRKQIKHLTTAGLALLTVVLASFMYIIWLTVYIISNNIFNNTLRILGGI